MSLVTILVVLILVSLLWGGFGGSGPYGWSPAGVLIVILLLLWLTGRL